jgi:hypothetical protein
VKRRNLIVGSVIATLAGFLPKSKPTELTSTKAKSIEGSVYNTWYPKVTQSIRRFADDNRWYIFETPNATFVQNTGYQRLVLWSDGSTAEKGLWLEPDSAVQLSIPYSQLHIDVYRHNGDNGDSLAYCNFDEEELA